MIISTQQHINLSDKLSSTVCTTTLEEDYFFICVFDLIYVNNKLDLSYTQAQKRNPINSHTRIHNIFFWHKKKANPLRNNINAANIWPQRCLWLWQQFLFLLVCTYIYSPITFSNICISSISSKAIKFYHIYTPLHTKYNSNMFNYVSDIVLAVMPSVIQFMYKCGDGESNGLHIMYER